MLLTVSGEPPLLVRVIDCAALLVATVWLAKVRLPGVRLAVAGVLAVVTVMVEPAL